MPTDEELDAMSLKLSMMPFSAHPPQVKATIMQLCIASDIRHNLGCVADEIESLRKWFEESSPNLDAVNDWFEKSKLWEGEVWTRK